MADIYANDLPVDSTPDATARALLVDAAGTLLIQGPTETERAAQFATAAQGDLADTATQPGDFSAQTWTPTWTNLTVGNGTVNAHYQTTGNLVTFQMKLTFGSTTSISGGGVSMSLPVTPADIEEAKMTMQGYARQYYITSVVNYRYMAYDDGAGKIRFTKMYDQNNAVRFADTTTTQFLLSPGYPFNFYETDVFAFSGMYRI